MAAAVVAVCRSWDAQAGSLSHGLGYAQGWKPMLREGAVIGRLLDRSVSEVASRASWESCERGVHEYLCTKPRNLRKKGEKSLKKSARGAKRGRADRLRIGRGVAVREESRLAADDGEAKALNRD